MVSSSWITINPASAHSGPTIQPNLGGERKIDGGIDRVLFCGPQLQVSPVLAREAVVVSADQPKLVAQAAHVRFTIGFVGSDGGDRSGGRAIDGGYNAVHFPSRGSRGISYPLDVNHYDASVNHAETIMVEPTKRSLPGLTICFDPEVKAAIEKAAKADKRSASSLVEIAVIAYLREKGFLSE